MTYDIKVLSTIDQWAARHPAPDKPALLTGMGLFSPRQIAAAVRTDAPVGRLFVKMLVHNSENLPLVEVLKRLGGNNPPALAITK